MGSSECETNTDVESLTGPQIKALRRGMGIGQTEMGKRIGCSRHAISYWETKPMPMRHRELKWGVPAQVLKILGVSVMLDSPRPNARERGGVLLPGLDTHTRARGGGVLQDSQQEWIDRECARINAKAMERAARYRQPCHAKTRKGHPCRNKSEPGRRRCKFHGGMSTGPKTLEGKARIAEAQRNRWKAYRFEKQSRHSGGP